MANVDSIAVSVQAAEVERQLSTQVHSLRDDFREKSMSTSQHMTRLEALQAEVSHYQYHYFHYMSLYTNNSSECTCSNHPPKVQQKNGEQQK